MLAGNRSIITRAIACMDRLGREIEAEEVDHHDHDHRHGCDSWVLRRERPFDERLRSR